MKTIKNHYFKDDGSHVQFMSGLPLPADPDNVVRNVRFEDCNFHPQCWHRYGATTTYENCEFVNCNHDPRD